MNSKKLALSLNLSSNRNNSSLLTSALSSTFEDTHSSVTCLSICSFDSQSSSFLSKQFLHLFCVCSVLSIKNTISSFKLQ